MAEQTYTPGEHFWKGDTLVDKTGKEVEGAPKKGDAGAPTDLTEYQA